MLSIVINILLTIHVLVALLIVMLVLMQRPKNEGLGAAFGGGMTDNLFGAQTTNVLQTITRWFGIIFFGLSLTLSWLYVKKAAQQKQSSVQELLLKAPAAPATSATPDAAAMDEVQKAIQKAIQEKGGEAKPADDKTAPVEAATPPVKPTDVTPTPAPEKPATPEKAPEPAAK
jgi:preprotein translocase subunit SecG